MSYSLPSSLSPYSRSLLLLLASLDIIAASLSVAILDIKVDSTFYISLLLWGATSQLAQNYRGRNYAHFQSITYHHLLSIFGHAVACLLLGIIFYPFISYTTTIATVIVLFWAIALSFKYSLFLVYFFLRNNLLHQKQYLIIGYSPQAYALRKFLKRQHGYLHRYAGTKNEPYCESDLEEIASYCIKNNVNTIYYAGHKDNPFISKLYLLANQHYIYLHFVLAYNDNRDYYWKWPEALDEIPVLTCRPNKDLSRKRKLVSKSNKLNVY